jgi:hypothetical protein
MPPNSNARKQRKTAPLLDPEFLQALLPQGTLQLTNGAAHILHDCQEEFVAQLTHHLADALGKGEDDDNDKDDQPQGHSKRRIRWVQPHHVEAAMTAMGLSDVWEEAMKCIQQQDDTKESAPEKSEEEPPKKRRKKRNWSRKGETFSDEMLAEQERLLAASREKQS